MKKNKFPKVLFARWEGDVPSEMFVTVEPELPDAVQSDEPTAVATYELKSITTYQRELVPVAVPRKRRTRKKGGGL